MVGDGEAETGPLATSWHSNKFLDPRRDGAVLPILHLNGYKIANPTVLARIPEDELVSLLRGYGWTPYVVSGLGPRGDAPGDRRDARPLPRRDRRDPGRGPRQARRTAARPRWPMIVLRSPKGWTGPKERRRATGSRATGARTRCRSPTPAPTRGTASVLEEWLRSYRPEELFDADGAPVPGDRATLHPAGDRRMSANPHANGGLLLRDLRLPDFRDYAVDGRRARAPARSRRPGCSAASCAT